MIAIGVASILLYPNAADSAHILSYMVQDFIPIGLKGFVIAGLLAVIMSTADTELNAGSVALVHDVIKKISTTKICRVAPSINHYFCHGSDCCDHRYAILFHS